MRVHLCAVGRLRAGPERDLVDAYSDRFTRIGRGIGLGPLNEIEVEDRTARGPVAEAALLARAIPDGATIWVLDERGRAATSPEFARQLARVRDAGTGDLGILIGGADGIDPALRQKADRLVSFGPMVWPHMLARVMLAEQLYRAAAILTGAPYHRA
ncbi:MAG: 23S rRNA (pseudouridine(1915)-N(3))-methyltransferase RlmH [Rhodobacteraceae bacterium]|nr:23S rRNA (pseudouridine(1915)-N(3))-methyltransferase RlmH [Paracoccaceae bacterium]